MKSQFKLAGFFFGVSLGVFFAALAVLCLPKEHELRTKLIDLTSSLEWEAGIRG